MDSILLLLKFNRNNSFDAQSILGPRVWMPFIHNKTILNCGKFVVSSCIKCWILLCDKFSLTVFVFNVRGITDKDAFRHIVS